MNQRKPVLSAGRHLNNTVSADARYPGLEPNAALRRLISDCRFSLAVENSSHPGYVTEKIAEAFLARTVPNYWGDPLVCQEFNPASFINVRDFASHAELVDYVMELDLNKERMLAMLNTSPLRKADQFTTYLAALSGFLRNIFNQDPTSARRRRDEKGLRRCSDTTGCEAVHNAGSVRNLATAPHSCQNSNRRSIFGCASLDCKEVCRGYIPQEKTS